MEWSIFELENKHIRIEKKTISKIPYLRFVPNQHDEVLPTIVYYHGWQSSKEYMRFQAMSIASFGFQVIVPDALHHGERGQINYEDPESGNKYLWEIIANSVEESTGLIEHVISECSADREQIYLIGSSMGAITVAGIFTMNQHIKGIAGFNGAYSWNRAIEMKVLPQSKTYCDFINEHDLSQHVDRIENRHILMLNGVEDSAVPIGLQREFYESVSEKNVRLIEFNCVGHRVSTSMLENLITWLHEVRS